MLSHKKQLKPLTAFGILATLLILSSSNIALNIIETRNSTSLGSNVNESEYRGSFREFSIGHPNYKLLQDTNDTTETTETTAEETTAENTTESGKPLKPLITDDMYYPLALVFSVLGIASTVWLVFWVETSRERTIKERIIGSAIRLVIMSFFVGLAVHFWFLFKPF